MAVSDRNLGDFATEMRRLAGRPEPALYQPYKTLLEAAYGAGHTVDSLLRAPGAGFPDFTVAKELRLTNWIEVKRPDVDIDPLPAADVIRLDSYRENLPRIVLTNGSMWILFEDGVETERVDVRRNWLIGVSALTGDQSRLLKQFFRKISTLAPTAASTYSEAVELLAAGARLLGQAILEVAIAGMPDSLTPDAPLPTSFAQILLIQRS